MDDLSASLAAVVQDERLTRGLSLAGLAEASGVSRAMISKIERSEAQPTAALLAKLSAALNLTLSELIARAEVDSQRLIRHAQQTVWQDPQTGYRRRAVSPPGSTSLELIEVELPAGAEVRYPAEAYRFIDQQIWMLEGHLRFIEGDEVHQLDPGDCLQLGAPQHCAFVNPTDSTCRYLVALDKLTVTRRDS
ncbi:helix-turn-helix domain-containing protein [Gulosibacter molinativorax]|uniref:Helix-turn-helix domain-containing protein n=1 Tax=Gulosibacter molinativorax TaxID=256821 RepID=A0ABT7C3S6_9MICO|nr:helix-turn-helix domain-containing protein [Gulosibacter molinativorax]MDJ1369895.1 helix-turn-helix domain-containing protein [Gulosibacter molinativorax]QUY61864.1 Helix-turn-helix family protein [Gulosibacter molinativorax]